MLDEVTVSLYCGMEYFFYILVENKLALAKHSHSAFVRRYTSFCENYVESAAFNKLMATLLK